MKRILNSIKNYLSLVKFSHTVFAMPFALIGFSLAVTQNEYQFSLKLLLLIILCMIFARNAAMSFNRYADKKFDALNPRTALREIPDGKVDTKTAIVFIMVNSILLIITTGFINRLTLLLSPFALFVILGYSLTKRITVLCHFILGLSLSLAPIGAYIAVTGTFNIIPIIYSLIVLTWVSGFDIIYSLQDDEFDKLHNLFSIPSRSNRERALVISTIIHFITFVLVIIAGLSGETGFYYWIGAALFTLLLGYQHLVVKPGDITRVNLAFATTNGIASILYAFFVILDLII